MDEVLSRRIVELLEESAGLKKELDETRESLAEVCYINSEQAEVIRKAGIEDIVTEVPNNFDKDWLKWAGIKYG